MPSFEKTITSTNYAPAYNFGTPSLLSSGQRYSYRCLYGHVDKSPSPSNVWYVNSAASRHMTGHRDWFTTFTALPDFHWSIKGISSHSFHATEIGKIVINYFTDHLWKTAQLEQVLYVPGLKNNLFSIMRTATNDI
jgi:hypothetical protein